MRRLNLLVIGAGVVGLSVARRMAGLGAAVEVWDAGHPGGESSRAAAGVAVPSIRLADDPAMLAFTRAAHPALVQALESLPGTQLLRRGQGVLRMVLDSKVRAELESKRDTFADELGEWVEGKDLPGLEPATEGSPLLGAYLNTQAFVVDTEAYLNALLADLGEKKVGLRLGTKVLRVESQHSEVWVSSPHETVAAEQVVLAAGAWSGQLSGLPSLPVKPIRGQMMTFLHPTLRLRHILSGPIYFAPWRAGEFVVGATEEDAGFAAHNTASGLMLLTASLAKAMPAMREAKFIRAWAGLRATTPNGRPWLGCLPHHPRVFVASGHGGQGILTGAFTGQCIAELLEGRASPAIEPFSPARQMATSG